MKKRWSWRGFTLVELLVVIAIIGILVALLLPAIQAAREAGRRISCGNNIKQLVLGMHDYHDVHIALPINYGNGTKGNAEGTDSTAKSWMSGILPFVEQKPLYDLIVWNDNPGASPPIYNDIGPGPGNPSYPNSNVADTVIKSFLCPSDGLNGKGRLDARQTQGDTVRAVTNYKGCSGANWYWGQDHGYPWLPEDYNPPPNPGGWGLDDGNGIVCRNQGDPASGNITHRDGYSFNYHDLAYITDGTSNTFAVGEAVPAWCTMTWWWSNWGTSATCGLPLNFKPPGVLTGAQTMESEKWNWPYNYTFMSRHPTGAQFGLADGAVRFIPDSIDFTTYKRLATAAGGRPAQVPN